MYKKEWCTCKVVVLRNKLIAFLTSSLPSPSSLLKLPKDPTTRQQRQRKERNKQTIGLIRKTTTYTCITLFLHFFAVTARLRRENAEFNVLWRSRRRNFISFFLNLDMVLRNSTPGGSAFIWRSKWVGISFKRRFCRRLVLGLVYRCGR